MRPRCSKDWHPPLEIPYHPDTTMVLLAPGWAHHTCNVCGLKWEQPD